MNTFTRATKRQSYLRLALEGPAGYGKTYTALVVATTLAPGKVAFLDTEAGSASKYADLFEFDVIEMNPPFHPDRAVAAIKDAEAAGYGAVICDSLSHFWTGEGGLLEVVDQIARTKYRNDSHRAWNDAGVIQQALVDAVLRSKLHVLAAMRTKKDYVRETYTDPKTGAEKTRIRAAGTKTIQRDEFDYEFDIVGRFDVPTMMAIVKSRCAALPPETVVEKPGAEFVATLAEWLGSGESFAEQEKAEKAAEAIAAKARKAEETAAEQKIADDVTRLRALNDEYKALVEDFDDSIVPAKIDEKRGTEDFGGWLVKQIAAFEKNVAAKQPSPFQVPASATAASADAASKEEAA